jgi:exopolysaccharide production protein ExoQ
MAGLRRRRLTGPASKRGLRPVAEAQTCAADAAQQHEPCPETVPAERPRKPGGMAVAGSFQPLRPSLTTGQMLFWAFLIFSTTSPFAPILTGSDPTVEAIRDTNSLRSMNEGANWPLYALRAGAAGAATWFALPQLLANISGVLTRCASILCFALWALISVSWSDAASTSLNANVAFSSIMIFGICLSARVPPQDLARVLVYSALIMGIFSTVWANIAPKYGVHQIEDFYQSTHAGSWRGVFKHKNIQGQIAAMYAAALLFTGPAIMPNRMLRWGTFALMIFLIFKSTSASALVIILLTPALVFLTTKLGGTKRLLAFMVAAAGVFIMAITVHAVLDMLGRDTTLTGRTIIWGLAFDSIAEKPFFGYGFLSTTYGEFTYRLVQTLGVLDPHNGYIDIVLGVGYLGLALFLFAIAMAYRAARQLYLRGGAERQAGLCLSAFISCWLLSALTESGMRPLAPMATIGLIAVAAMNYAGRNPARHNQQGLKRAPSGTARRAVPQRGHQPPL